MRGEEDRRTRSHEPRRPEKPVSGSWFCTPADSADRIIITTSFLREEGFKANLQVEGVRLRYLDRTETWFHSRGNDG